MINILKYIKEDTGESKQVQEQWTINSVTQLCPALCDPMDCSTPSFPVHHQLPEPTQTHVHWVSDAIQPPHPLLSPSSPALNLSQNQGLFQWVSSSHQVDKLLEFQLQHQSFQWIFRTNFLEEWLVWSLCHARDSQESFPTPQFKNINSSVLSFLSEKAMAPHSSTLAWKIPWMEEPGGLQSMGVTMS